jgi:hypothetical protein
LVSVQLVIGKRMMEWRRVLEGILMTGFNGKWQQHFWLYNGFVKLFWIRWILIGTNKWSKRD